MIKTERQQRILDAINEKKFCRVSQLAKELYVSPVTVRRDITELERAGLVKRCHGGVSVYSHFNREVPLEVRENSNTPVKSELGKRAAALIRTGDTVFLDASSTALHIIDHITAENVTVITNSLAALDKLRDRHIRAYCTGGLMLENSMALAGALAERTVEEMYADIMFFSTQGIDENGDITDFSETETALRKKMLAHAARRVYMFDSSKLNKKFLFGVCNIKDVDEYITDADIEF